MFQHNPRPERLSAIEARDERKEAGARKERPPFSVPPKEPIYAVWNRYWKKLSRIAQTVPTEDEGTCQLQLWHFNPALCAAEGKVDPFSLHLSPQTERDERVELALEKIMEKLEW